MINKFTITYLNFVFKFYFVFILIFIILLYINAKPNQLLLLIKNKN